MPWIRAAGLAPAEVRPGELRVLRLLGRACGVRRGADGALVAFELACRHQGADLSAGAREGSIVTCPRHGWRYDLDSGACLTDATLPLRRLELREADGRLFLRIGAEAGPGEGPGERDASGDPCEITP